MRAALIFLLASVSFAAPKTAPKSAPASDAVVEAAIRAKFAKSKINEDKFQVSVRSGVATIEGKTDVPQRKGVATRLAKTGGAREVVNKVQIGEAARKKLSDRLQKAREAKPPNNKAVPKSATNVATPPPVKTASAQVAPPIRRMEIKH